MNFGGTKAAVLLFVGDALIFIVSLWLTLAVRYGMIPSSSTWNDHLPAFSFLFIIWFLVFYIAGLYGKRIIFFKSKLSGVILRVQSLNIALASIFFFFVPNIGIAPKTNLVLYLVISLILIFVWRLWIFPRLTTPTSRIRAAILGSGPEVLELVNEVNSNARYNLEFSVITTPKEIEENFNDFAARLAGAKISLLVVDTTNEKLRPFLGKLYELALVTHNYQFADLYDVYEEIFDRVPLSLLQYDWFLKNARDGASNFYDIAKRIIDILGGLAMGLITLILIPILWVLMRIEGRGPLFITQERLGKFGTKVYAYKFRTMQKNDTGAWKGEGENRITKLGSILRQTSLDEFPQCINILRGDVSLIGPRNDMQALAVRLAEAIPYYNIRYTVKPGITGWAQINQQYEQGNISPQSIEETKTRLAYDFYYIKNRSFGLDIVIAAKTLKRMLFRVSSW